jgi:hypothetical protein
MIDREAFCILIWQRPSRMDPNSTDLRIMISWQFLMGQDMLVIHEHLVSYQDMLVIHEHLVSYQDMLVIHEHLVSYQDMLVIHEHLVSYPANCHNRSVYCSNVCSLVVFYHSVWTVIVFVYLHRSYTQRCLWSSVMRVECTSHYNDKLCILMFAFFLFVSTTTRQWSNALFVIFDKRTFWLKMLCKQLCTEKDWRYQNDKR